MSTLKNHFFVVSAAASCHYARCARGYHEGAWYHRICHGLRLLLWAGLGILLLMIEILDDPVYTVLPEFPSFGHLRSCRICIINCIISVLPEIRAWHYCYMGDTLNASLQRHAAAIASQGGLASRRAFCKASTLPLVMQDGPFERDLEPYEVVLTRTDAEACQVQALLFVEVCKSHGIPDLYQHPPTAL